MGVAGVRLRGCAALRYLSLMAETDSEHESFLSQSTNSAPHFSRDLHNWRPLFRMPL